MNNLVSPVTGQEYGPGKPSRRKFLHLLAAKFGFIALLAQGAPAMAAEVKVLAGAALRGGRLASLSQSPKARRAYAGDRVRGHLRQLSG